MQYRGRLTLSTLGLGGICLASLLVALTGRSLAAQEEADDANGSAELAKKLQNPVAALISVPFQSNFEWGAGSHSDGFKYTLNFQPVIPISISADWNLISRTIVPFIHQDDLVPGSTAPAGA